MLSILIPTYNYNAYPLAALLAKEAQKLSISYEIICLDDGSGSEINIENRKINTLAKAKFIESKTNQGRIATRLTLAKMAKNDWLLFLDSDMIPKNRNFLEQYINVSKRNYKVIFGGYAYKEGQYSEECSLRFYFGKNREEKSAEIRNLSPYKNTLSGNLLIQKDIFTNIFNQDMNKAYGMDYFFGSELKKLRINVLHINNETYHLGLEDNKKFLIKSKEAIETLSKLYSKGTIQANEISLLKAYGTLKTLGLTNLFSSTINLFNRSLEKNLHGKSPSLLFFDIYRLKYFCKAQKLA